MFLSECFKDLLSSQLHEKDHSMWCLWEISGNSEPGDIEDHQFTRSEVFREYSMKRSSIWKHIARNYAELRIKIRSQLDCKKIWDCIVLGSGGIWTMVPNTSRREWWFWRLSPACREYTHPRNDPRSRVFAGIRGGTNIRPVVQVRVAFLLNHCGIEIEIPSPSRPKMNSWVVIYRGRNRLVNELHIHKPVHCNTGSEWLREEENVKKYEPRDTNTEPSSVEGTRANPSRSSDPTSFTKESGQVSPLVQISKGRHFPQMTRTMAREWNVIMIKKSEKLTERFTGTIYLRNWWMHSGIKGNNKMRFGYCQNSEQYCIFLQFKVILVDTWWCMQELMGPVEIPYNWREFVFHRGCSSNGNSNHETGLVAGVTESKEGRQTIFFTHLNAVGENQDEEEPDGDLSKPRKVHYHSNWWHNQDAVYQIILTYWWTHGNARTDGSRWHPVQLEIICLPQRMLFQRKLHPWDTILSTESRVTILANEIECNYWKWSCASKLHLQSHLPTRRPNTTRKTSHTSTSTKGDSRRRMSNAAAVTITAAATSIVREHLIKH